MGRPRAWFRVCACPASLEADIRNSLAAAGIECIPLDEARPNIRYGIVCFAEVSDEVLSLLRLAQHQSWRVLAIAVPASGEALPAWQLLHAGASDTLAWDREGVAARQIGVKLARWSKIDDLVNETLSNGFLIGRSPVWLGLVRRLVEAAHFSTAPILLTGESGTGKELLAKLVSMAMRSLSVDRAPRRELVTVDCGALVPELSGSEFFGHERGAFTDAHAARDGAFALADGATLLLDEIGEIPLPLQPQILRAIQEKTYKRLGGNAWRSTNFRLVSATNRNLEELVRQGGFRQDLYYRIAGCVFHIPPLRDRREDILPLASHLLGELLATDAPELDAPVRDYLLNRDYPGNVRELRQLMQRIASRYSGTGPITVGDLSEEDRPELETHSRAWPNERFEKSIAEAITLGASFREITRTTAQTAIQVAIESEDGSIRRAAKRLKITDRAVQMRRASGLLQSKRDFSTAAEEINGTTETNPGAGGHSRGWAGPGSTKRAASLSRLLTDAH